MEVWLPWLEGLIPLVLVVGAIWFVHRHQPRPALAKVATAIGLVAFIAAGLIVSAFLLSAQGCEEDRALVGSPDGRHVARMMIWGSVPTGSSLRVIERRSWSPVWQEVSSAGSVGTPLEPIEPRILWSDNSHLVIDYPEATEGSGFTCESHRVGDILIVCKTHKL